VSAEAEESPLLDAGRFFYMTALVICQNICLLYYYCTSGKLKKKDAVTRERYPCGGGVEYLHRDPASRKSRRNGTKKAAP
jgi:hypothetical protein